MRSAARTLAALAIALIVLAATVWLIYRWNVVYSGAWGIAPLFTGATALLLGLLWALDWQRANAAKNLFFSGTAIVLGSFAGFWVWLLTACSLGDCF